MNYKNQNLKICFYFYFKYNCSSLLFLFDNMDKQKEDFKKLNNKEKQQKLYLFVEKLDFWDELLHTLKVFLEEKTKISDDFLIETYFDLLDFADALKENNRNKVLLHLKITQERLKKFTQLEKKERENADFILWTID